MKKLDYMLYAAYGYDTERLSGLFQWPRAFNHYGSSGHSKPTLSRDTLEQYDIIHVNYLHKNSSYIPAIREALGKHSSTIIIANVDFAMLMWHRTDPILMKSMLSIADFVFHVEPMGAKRLGFLLQKDVPCIPHPVDVDFVRNLRSPMISGDPILWTCQYHRYFDTWCDSYYPTHRLKREYGARTVLMNITKPTPDMVMPYNSYYDDLLDVRPYTEYLKHLSKAYINIDITPDYTYGRGVVDAAALQIPTITGTTNYAGKLLFPELQVTVGDDEKVEQTIRALMDEPDYMKGTAEHGAEEAGFFSLKNSYYRLTSHLEVRDLV